jgi:hypothetical protein
LVVLTMPNQQCQKRLAIGVVFENQLPVVTAQDDMVRVTGQCETGQSGHAAMVMRAEFCGLSGVHRYHANHDQVSVVLARPGTCHACVLPVRTMVRHLP